MAEAFAQLNRYGRLVVEVEGIGDGPRFQLVAEGREIWMQDLRIGPNEFPELTEATWSRFICGTRRDFPDQTFALAVQVTHPAPAHRDAYDRIWQVPTTFACARNAIQVDPRWLTVTIQPESRYIFGVLTDRADALLADLNRSQSTSGQVKSLLMPILHTGTASVDTIATKLGMSRQTLFRKLRAEGVTYEKVLDELRHTLALHYLSGEKVSVNETAYLVGFSEPAAFSRAFKRWTGRSPRDVRGR